MRKKYKIGVCTPIFPNHEKPESGAFVAKLVQEWLEFDVDVVVFNPQPFFKRHSENINYKHIKQVNPKYLSFSFLNRNKIVYPVFSRIYKFLMLKAHLFPHLPDVNYGKFLMSGGYLAYLISKKYGVPYVLDLGESKLSEGFNSQAELDLARLIVKNASGIVCVSCRLKNEAIELGFEESKILLAPNDVDKKKFYKIDKKIARTRLGLPFDKKIIAFTGHYIERKGPLRVKAALDLLGKDYVGVFMGSGPQVPAGVNVLHSGSVPNNELVFWLNASDVFVLPTLAEGSCNAIHEALACGVPIVTSDIEDMDEFRGFHSITFVDPENVQEIANRIAFRVKTFIPSVEFDKKNISRGGAILTWIKELNLQ
jgi:teichuronic acid biosynthesis glycosyltransferase TuaC